LDQKLQLRAESELKSELASNPLKTELVTQVIWIAFFRDIKIKIQKHILWSYCCACMMYDQFEMGKIVLEKQNALLPLATAIKDCTLQRSKEIRDNRHTNYEAGTEEVREYP
jgi:hypothetical protein